MTDKTSPVRRLLLGAGFAASFAIGGLVLPPAASAMQDAMAQQEMGGHMGMGALSERHGAMHAMMHAHVARMLADAGATPEQTARIHEILKRAFDQIAPVHQRLASTHRDLHRILAAPTVDRAALEHLRAERMADVDQASRVLVQALADAAEVLTPEQRARLAAAAERHAAAHAQP